MSVGGICRSCDNLLYSLCLLGSCDNLLYSVAATITLQSIEVLVSVSYQLLATCSNNTQVSL